MCAIVQQLIADVAYPDKYPNILDPVELGDRYASVIITDDYFQNIISFAKAKNHWRFAKLYKSAEEAEWDVTVDMVNVRIPADETSLSLTDSLVGMVQSRGE